MISHGRHKPQLMHAYLVEVPLGLRTIWKQLQLRRNIVDDTGMKRVFENAGANLLMVVIGTREYDKIDAGPRVQDKYQLLQGKVDRLLLVFGGKTPKPPTFRRPAGRNAGGARFHVLLGMKQRHRE